MRRLNAASPRNLTSRTATSHNFVTNLRVEMALAFAGAIFLGNMLMIVSTAKIEATYRKVKHIKEHMRTYCLAPDRAKLSVEDLQWCIADMYQVKIEKHEVAFEGEYLRGLVERYKER